MERIEAEAALGGRSLSGEIISRLETSFRPATVGELFAHQLSYVGHLQDEEEMLWMEFEALKKLLGEKPSTREGKSKLAKARRTHVESAAALDAARGHLVELLEQIKIAMGDLAEIATPSKRGRKKER